MHYDEKEFPNTEIFDPDHYLGVTNLAPELAAAADCGARDHYSYGLGRSLCADIPPAETNLFLGITKRVWGFDIRPEKYYSGNVIEPDVDTIKAYSEGFLVCAHLFECKIQVRSEKRETILRELNTAEKDVFSIY
jgi:hypothetical protein